MPISLSLGRIQIKAFLASLLLAYSVHILADPLEAFVDRTMLSPEEDLTLTIEYQGKSDELPDFSKLEKDFQIESQSQGSEVRIINGVSRSKKTWTLQLSPKRTGQLPIPAFKIDGDRSKPIQITISEGRSRPDSSDLSFVVSTDRSQVYLNAQLILTVRLSSDSHFLEGNLSELQAEDAFVQPLGEPEKESTVENGRRNISFVQRFALFPKKAGVLRIPAFHFTGRLTSAEKKPEEFFGFFGRARGKRIRRMSNAVTVEVMPIPTNFPKDAPWLPLKNLVIAETWDSYPPLFAVNQAATRTIEIIAQGSLAAFLPTIDKPKVENLKIYAEKAQKIDEPTKEGLVAKLTESQVYMPTGSVQGELPEQKIYWWDTETDELRVAAIKPQKISVQGLEVPPQTKKPEEAPRPSEKPLTAPTESPDWFYLFGAALALIVLAFLVWRRFKKRNIAPIAAPPGEDFLMKEVLQACNQNSDHEAYAKILNWQRAYKATHGHMPNFAPNLKEAINDLQSHLFNPAQHTAWSGHALASALKEMAHEQHRARTKKTGLASLYPEAS